MRLSNSPHENLAIPPLTRGRRRRLTNEQKREILTQGLSQRLSISEVGRRYDIPVTLLFRWKKDLKISFPPASAFPPVPPEARIAELEERLTRLEQLNQALITRLQQNPDPR